MKRWTRKRLLELADSDGVITRGSVSVRVWPSGDITRCDIDLSLALKMSVSEAVETLKLQQN